MNMPAGHALQSLAAVLEVSLVGARMYLPAGQCVGAKAPAAL